MPLACRTGSDATQGTGRASPTRAPAPTWVVAEVETVGDLEGLGPGGGRRIGVGARTVAADHLDPGMGCEPWGEGGGVTLGQQIEDLVGFVIDHNC